MQNRLLVSQKKAADQLVILGTMGSAHAKSYETILGLYERNEALLAALKEVNANSPIDCPASYEGDNYDDAEARGYDQAHFHFANIARAAIALAERQGGAQEDETEPVNQPIGTCPKCGVPVYTSEGFCGTCGH